MKRPLWIREIPWRVGCCGDEAGQQGVATRIVAGGLWEWHMVGAVGELHPEVECLELRIPRTGPSRLGLPRDLGQEAGARIARGHVGIDINDELLLVAALHAVA